MRQRHASEPCVRGSGAKDERLYSYRGSAARRALVSGGARMHASLWLGGSTAGDEVQDSGDALKDRHLMPLNACL